MRVLKTIHLNLKAAGCETACMHCWADGGHYPNMPFADLEFAVQSIHDFCIRNNYSLGFYTMHELLAHPDALRILQLQKQEFNANPFCNVIPTSGIPIAIRNDYKELLEELLNLGHNVLYFTLHGMGKTHDITVGRKGAFEELKIAMERTKAAGLQYGFNVYLTKRNIPQFKEMREFLHKAGIDKASVEIASYCPVKRSRIYDEIRVEYSDLIPLMDELKEMCIPGSRKIFENIEEYTEASYYQKAVEGISKDYNFYGNKHPDEIPLVCDRDLKIYNGDVDSLGKCYGSLKENAETVFKNINEDIIHGQTEYLFSPAFYYPNESIPPLNVLAKGYGDPNGRKIYPHGIYYKWLDKAFRKISMHSNI